MKNVVRHYRKVLDAFISAGPLYGRASAGRLEGGFTPDPDKTFGRGWTEALLDGRKEKMASGDAAKSLGEYIGEITAVKGRDITVRTGKLLSNGDGLSFVGRSDQVLGGRAETVSGSRVSLRDVAALTPGMRVYRNYDIRFEHELENNMPRRVIDVTIGWHSTRSASGPAGPGISPAGETVVTAVTEDGFRVEKRFADEAAVAEKPDMALDNLRRQLGKHTGPFAFSVGTVLADPVRFYPAAFLNGIRRELAAQLQALLENRPRNVVPHEPRPGAAVFNRSTLDVPEELMRSRYCIRWELGLCPKRCPVKPGMTPGVTPDLIGGPGPLYLVNQKNRLRLDFDCARCEMIVRT